MASNFSFITLDAAVEQEQSAAEQKHSSKRIVRQRSKGKALPTLYKRSSALRRSLTRQVTHRSGLNVRNDDDDGGTSRELAKNVPSVIASSTNKNRVTKRKSKTMTHNTSLRTQLLKHNLKSAHENSTEFDETFSRNILKQKVLAQHNSKFASVNLRLTDSIEDQIQSRRSSSTRIKRREHISKGDRSKYPVRHVLTCSH